MRPDREHMTRETLEQLIASGEGLRTEFKETTGQRGEACRTLCAFLNGEGGTLVFGVTRKGRLVGQFVSDETKRDLARAFCDFEPSADIVVEYVPVDDSHQAIVCTVSPGARRPYVYDGRPYVRVESTTVKMSQVDYDVQLRSRRGYASTWEREANADLAMDDLDLEEVRRTARLAVRVGRLDESVDTENAVALLDHFHVREKGALLNAAGVLFGNVHMGNYPQCQLKLGWFKGLTTETFNDIDKQCGHIGRLMDAAMHFCFKHLNLSARFDGSIERTEELEIPAAALREALINAFAHRSYEEAGETVYLAIFDDRVEIRNPGTFPPELNPTRLFSSPQERSIPRNPTIANVLYLRKSIETWGRGLGVMANECMRAGLCEPTTEVRNGLVVTTLWRPRSGTGNLDQIWIRSGSKAIQMSEPRLSELCSRLLEIVRLNPLVSRRTLSDELGVSERKVRESIDLMRKNGIILRQGAEHGGIWRISKVVKDCGEQKHSHEITSGTTQKKETAQKVSTHKTSLKTTQKSVAAQKPKTRQSGGKKSRQKIVDLISSDPYVTTEQLVEKMGISRDGVNYNIRELKKTGVLRRVGGRKFGHWEVCDAESFVAAKFRRPSASKSSDASPAW